MLHDSPWARQFVALAEPGGTDRTASDVDSNEAARGFVYVVQLRSALPIRQALARQAFLAAQRQRTDPAQLQQIRTAGDQLVASSFNDVVLVHVFFHSKAEALDRALRDHWRRVASDAGARQVVLIAGDGTRVPAAHLSIPAAHELEATFPRSVNGRPLIVPGDKTLTLEFPDPPLPSSTAPNATGVRQGKVRVEFSVEAMMRNGELVF